MQTFRTEDYHTAGEPFRIVADPGVEIPGASVAERRVAAMNSPELDGVRKLLCFEPRGHADMYGGFITPPDDDGAHLGVLFWHKDGFSTACGHGTIALGVWAVHSGLVAAPDTGITDVVIDVPSGRVTARVHTDSATVTGVDFVNVASYVLATDVPVSTSRGDVLVDVSYGGAIYTQLDVAELGLAIEPAQVSALIELGREIKWALNDEAVAQHPSDPRLSGIYGTILFENVGDASGALVQRNATIFADGELDRSPCGSGTCARVATLVHRGVLTDDRELTHRSIVGSTFQARVRERSIAEGRDAVLPEVSGMAYRTGESVFSVDPTDPLVPGFVLR